MLPVGLPSTADDEPRCFSGYTQYLRKAERYALGDFKEHGYGSSIKDDEPVELSINFCNKWRDYDTVLVDADLYDVYCKLACLPIKPPKEE